MGDTAEIFSNFAKRSIDSLSYSDDDLGRFLQISPLPGFVEAHGLISVLNSEAARLLGYSHPELLGKRTVELLALGSRAGWAEIIQRSRDCRETCGALEFVHLNGSLVSCDIFIRPLPDERSLVMLNDVSQQKQADATFLEVQKQRWKVQKTEALEKLAGGIAHDFNNFLAVILLQTDMMNLQLIEDSPLRERVSEIKAVANDAAGIVRQLLAFGRRQPMSPSPVVLNDLVKGLARDVSALVGGNVGLELGLKQDLGVCFVDPKQIAHALMYLTVNARDAMPDGGTLRIETENILLNQTHIPTNQAKGGYIQVSVTDTGIGMDASTEDRAFEPFFSTKASDKGAGLSLATVYGIVKQSGGFIWVTSEKGKGTTFRIQFPRVDQPEIAEGPSEPLRSERSVKETILLVDDDRSVRGVAAESLVRSGYKVIEAGTGMEAVEIARSYSETIHLLLTDISMPAMSGNDTAQNVKELQPDIRILYISGSHGDLGSHPATSTGRYHFLSKPFSSSELALKVREVLDS